MYEVLERLPRTDFFHVASTKVTSNLSSTSYFTEWESKPFQITYWKFAMNFTPSRNAMNAPLESFAVI